MLETIKKIKTGFITIGQSPRPYIMDAIAPTLERSFDIIEDGALNGYTYDEILKEFPFKKGSDFFVTELSDGTEVHINLEHIKPLVQKSIDRLENKGAKIIVLMCTGEMGGFKSNVLFVESSEIIKSVAAALGKNKKVGVLIPDENQREQMEKRWRETDIDAEICALSPYISFEEAEEKVTNFRDRNWDMAVLDCMGYTKELKQAISDKLNIRVLLSRSVVASVISELS
jgi:protein AroM